MGSSSSKAVSNASRGSIPRKFPSRPLGAALPTSARPGAGSAQRSPPLSDTAKAQATSVDARELEQISGDFSRRLHDMGIVQPKPTFSPSSQANLNATQSHFSAPMFPPARNNVTLSVLEARRELEKQAEEELEHAGRPGHQGRQFLNMRTVMDAVGLREQGVPTAAIEQRLGLKPGVLSKLGSQDILTPASTR